MMIREMSRNKCLRVLAQTRLARLACTRENQPYIVPVYLVYDELPDGGAALYGFTTPGQKVEWMRANPQVCVEVDDVAEYDKWVSVIVLGHYEELPQAPGFDDQRLRAQERPKQINETQRFGEAIPNTKVDQENRLRAWQILKTDPAWQEPGCAACAARAHRGSAEPWVSVFYRIRIDQVTGHEATRESRVGISYALSVPHTVREGWLRKTLARVFGGR
ncbi:pyridoxamine 5'-phosphate oxidase family protein [soil metagenome]